MIKTGDLVYFGTEYANDEPSRTYEERRRRCYELAAYAILSGSAPRESKLVHGTIDGGAGTLGRIGHAWLILPDTRVWEPILREVWDPDEWKDFANAWEEKVYTCEEVHVHLASSGHYGRWHVSQYK